MSKYAKDLCTAELAKRLEGVQDALVVSVAGLDSFRTSRLRTELRAKNMRLLVIKNSLARRATAGTRLAAAFEGLDGPAAILFGGTDIVDLAKEVARVAGDKAYEKFQSRGGVLDGAPLTAAEVEGVSKWPTREEQLSLLVGQILGPGATLVAQLTGAGATLAGQIKEKATEAEGEAQGDAAPAAEEA